MEPPVSDAAASLYRAKVMHRRLGAPRYRFVYRVFYLFVDVDRIEGLDRRLRLFSVDRFNLLSLRTRDYGDGRGLRAWAEALLRENGVDACPDRIRLLTLPRVLGFAFNPINLWYCERADGAALAVIAEVNNTFGEKHCYLLRPNPAADSSEDGPAPYLQAVDKPKIFHVSPFLPRRGHYRFDLSRPAAGLRVLIREFRDGAPVMNASLLGRRQALTDGAILGQVARMPWMTLKVVAGIHWQALKLWLRGARFHRKPAPLNPHVS